LHDDGVLATLPSACGGVSVADLGGDGVWDFFTGQWWVRLGKDGKVTTTSMIDATEEVSSMQPTITDLDGDSMAEILFATPSGKVVVYQTKLAIKPQWLQWPTNGGGIRHT